MTEEKRRFTVINNEELEKREKERKYTEQERFERIKRMSYQSNPLNIQGQSLKEQFLKFRNEEAGPRFTVEDLLKW